jgi:hypothetical protein
MVLCALAALALSVGVHAAVASNRTAAAGPAPSDPNTLGRSAGDAVAIVRWLSPGTYQLDVQNTSGIGYINQFTWTPPPALTVTGVTSTEGGKCSLSGSVIVCSGKVRPPDCTCLPGGDLTVTFTANGLEPTFAHGYWTYYGIVGASLQITQMTPVPYHIPSALPLVSQDLPLCKKGVKSTKKHPCATV